VISLLLLRRLAEDLEWEKNMYPSTAQDKDASIACLPVDELIKKADGFARVFPGEHCVYIYLMSLNCTYFITLVSNNMFNVLWNRAQM
jgi:hypothetical protein